MHKSKDNINVSLVHLSNENRLLLCCTRSEEGKCTPDEISGILSESVNWDEVLESAEWHSVMPLLYKTLSRVQDRAHVPDNVMDRLKSSYKANVARNMFLFSDFKTVVEALQQKGVKVIVLKGAALASEIYNDVGLRQMSDIDLLIKKRRPSSC